MRKPTRMLAALLLPLLAAPPAAQEEPAAEIKRLERLEREIKRFRLRLDLGLPVGEKGGCFAELLARVLRREEKLDVVLGLMGLAEDASPGAVAEALQESHYAELNLLSERKAEFKRLLARPELSPAAVRRVLEAAKRKWRGKRPPLPSPPPAEGKPPAPEPEPTAPPGPAGERIAGLAIDRRELAHAWFAKGRELAARGDTGKKSPPGALTPMACFKEARRLYGRILERRGHDPILHLRHAQAAAEIGFLLLGAFGDDPEGRRLIEQAREELASREALLPDHLRFHEEVHGPGGKRVEEVFHLYRAFRELIDRRLRFRRIASELPMPGEGEE